ncbi:MAG: glycosyltransferase family 4 protein [Acidobacteriota bacterium]
MRISYITAGAGGMYCGSCLRDNTLAAAMKDAGHDVLLIPTYTPTRTDETNFSHRRVFLGGINVYLEQRFRLFRRLPRLLHRLLDVNSVLRLATSRGVSVNPAELGELTVSMLRGVEGPQDREIRTLVRFLAEEARPDVINLPNCLLISLAPAIKQQMNLPVCCTLQGEELFLKSLPEPYRAESIRLIRSHSEYVDAFIAVSAFGAQCMSGYLQIDRARIRVAPLGIHFDGYERRTGADPEPFTIGYLARVAPEKGLHLLCESYRRLRSRADLPPSRLCAAGYLAPEHSAYLENIKRDFHSAGLDRHFEYKGEFDRPGKIAFLHNLSLLSVPATYDEPKGLSLLEAMAAGVPVVQPRRGAFTEVIERTGGGILVQPDDPDALAEGILELWRHPAKRKEMGERGYCGVREHHGAVQMARRVLAIYEEIRAGS